ncbi:MAG: alpha/beta fold hydrolase [Cyanobacteria bacterium P01_D01_bin.105]
MPYEDVWIAVDKDQMHGWWIPADESKRFSVLRGEPAHVLTQPKVMLYFCGIGNNMGDYNYLARAAALRQLGFSVLVFDYRGYGRSDGDFPSEAQLYADGEAAWTYLQDEKGIAAEDILLYGESMGGAIALNLAVNHPDAGGLIMQSTFTSMAETVKHNPVANAFPIDWILHEEFDSAGKIDRLNMPVLFIHGSKDSVVPVSMSRLMYQKVSGPKRLWIIPEADHVSIYQPIFSYLKAVAQFTYDFIEK